MNEAPLGKAGHDVDKIYVRERRASAPPKAERSRKSSLNKRVGLAKNGTLIHPSPRRGVYRSNSPGINVPFAADLWRLLHLDRALAVAHSNGCYRGRRMPITCEDLDRHLTGEIAIAFGVLRGSHALFAVLDVDALFRDLLGFIRKAAGAIGGEDLAAAIFCTGGSDDGRGKVIVTFAQPVPSNDARKLIMRLFGRVRASEPAQDLPSNKLSAYPQKKSGGVTRILGRNVARGGSLEKPFSLDGEPGLAHVRPLAPAKLAAILADSGPKILEWAKKRIETAWLRVEGTDTHFRWMIALAREAIRLYGVLRGRPAYDEWLDHIKAKSPELSFGSLKNADQRNVLDHGRERAWQYACERPNGWEPSQWRIRNGVPRGIVRLYCALVAYVLEKGLRRSAFGMELLAECPISQRPSKHHAPRHASGCWLGAR